MIRSGTAPAIPARGCSVLHALLATALPEDLHVPAFVALDCRPSRHSDKSEAKAGIVEVR
jgi:hypothetical protein